MNEIVLGAIGFGVAMLLVGLMYCVLDWLHARKVAARFDEAVSHLGAPPRSTRRGRRVGSPHRKADNGD